MTLLLKIIIDSIVMGIACLLKYEEYKINSDNFSSTKLLLEDSDPEIKSLAQDELNIITEQLSKNELEIKKLLIPENEDDEKDVFLEISSFDNCWDTSCA